MSSLSFPLAASVPLVPDQVTAVVRRRPTRAQGAALEMLGHAIEYLVDSNNSQADGGALHILMCASRRVFSECALIVPWHTRMRRRLHLC